MHGDKFVALRCKKRNRSQQEPLNAPRNHHPSGSAAGKHTFRGGIHAESARARRPEELDGLAWAVYTGFARSRAGRGEIPLATWDNPGLSLLPTRSATSPVGPELWESIANAKGSCNRAFRGKRSRTCGKRDGKTGRECGLVIWNG